MIGVVWTTLKAAWSWTGDHATASGVMVAMPLFAVLLAIHEASDWFTASVTLAAGLCWVGALLPVPVRGPTILLAGGIAAVSGSLVSIIFSRTLNSGQSDEALTPFFFALLIAGSASLYGQHRNASDRRRADEDLAAALLRLEQGQQELRDILLRGADAPVCGRCAPRQRPWRSWRRP